MSVTPQKDYEPAEVAKLIIRDQPYQFLPHLAAIYGDSCALMLQQLHFTTTRPYFMGELLPVKEYEGLVWVKIHPYMWWDTLEGITRHLSRATWYRYRKALVDCGAWRVESHLGQNDRTIRSSKKDEDAQWYANNTAKIDEHFAAYRTVFDAAKAKRDAERALIKREHGADAHWRPMGNDDTSKVLDDWRLCFAEFFEEVDGPDGRILRKKNVSAPKRSRESQSEIYAVSPDLKLVRPAESQNEIQSISPDLPSSESHSETLVESHSETPDNLTLRLSPYIQTTSLEVEQQTIASADANEQSATPPAPVSSEDDAVVQSQNDLSQLRTARKATPPLAELAARLLSVADDCAIEIADADALQVVGAWPQATITRAALVEAVRKVARFSREVATSLVQKNEVEVRWQLVLWERRPQSKHGYFKCEGGEKPGTRAGAFRSTIESGWAPHDPDTWLSTIASEIKTRRIEAEYQEQTAEAKAFFETLSPNQQDFFFIQWKEKCLQAYIGDIESQAAKRLRVKMLLDPALQKRLQEWNAPGAGTPVPPVVARLEADETLTTAERKRADYLVGRLAITCETVEEVPSQVEALPGFSQPARKYIRESVIAQMTQQKQKAA